MNSPIKIYRVSAQLEKDAFAVKVSHWKLLLETNRYYEIKPESGPVKRIYKEKLNLVTDDTKSYTDGYLACSAFCVEERIHEMHIELLHKLQNKVKAYMEELQLNQRAIELQFRNPQNGPDRTLL